MMIKSTKELPDDVGSVFVTRVPGAPFQALGRRAPDGELHVGSRLYPHRMAEFDDIMAGLDDLPVEIITGREAERLLAMLCFELES
jgi:hypothetical protein